MTRHLRLAALTANAELKPVRIKPAVQGGGGLAAALPSHCSYGLCGKPEQRGIAMCSSLPQHLTNSYLVVEIQGRDYSCPSLSWHNSPLPHSDLMASWDPGAKYKSK